MDTSLINLIKEMADVDQKSRKMARQHIEKTGENFSVYNLMIYSIDGIHQQRIKQIIKEGGYPSHQKIGEEGMKHFWIIIQHQDMDVKLQRECLDNCDFDPIEKAYLTDRVLINEGGEQIYGTQFPQDTTDEKKVFYNKNREDINKTP